MFIAALFLIAKGWKQPRCPFGEWMNKFWHASAVEHFGIKNEMT